MPGRVYIVWQNQQCRAFPLFEAMNILLSMPLSRLLLGIGYMHSENLV